LRSARAAIESAIGADAAQIAARGGTGRS
jgi:hypothetical protein